MQKLHWYMQHRYSILFAEEEGEREIKEKKHLHCTLGNSTPIFILLTINHYQ